MAATEVASRYYVEIVTFLTDEVVKRMGPHDMRTAERIQRGANINLNHGKFFTRIVEETRPRCQHTTYVIRSTEGEGYWSNEDGWVAFASATHFTSRDYNLPLGGAWFTCEAFVERYS